VLTEFIIRGMLNLSLFIIMFSVTYCTDSGGFVYYYCYYWTVPKGQSQNLQLSQANALVIPAHATCAFNVLICLFFYFYHLVQ